MQGFTSPPSFGKNLRWPTKMATNEHFRSGFRNGNNQNFFLDTFRIPNMYVKKMCSSGVGEVTSLLYYKGNSEVHLHTHHQVWRRSVKGPRRSRGTNRQTDKRCSIYSMMVSTCKPIYAKPNYYLYSFFPHTVSNWNQLP